MSKRKSGLKIDRTQSIGIGILIVIVISGLFIIDNPNALNLNLGAITGGVATEYRTPVGGTITISYTINTWNGRQWYWSDLDTYQYDYDVINLDTGRVIARGLSFRLIHSSADSITMKMNVQGTYNYRLQEYIVFLREGGRKMNGTAKDFKVIVGSGINPTPEPTPVYTQSQTASEQPLGQSTIIMESQILDEATVITTPEKTTTFVPEVFGQTPPPPDVITIPQQQPSNIGLMDVLSPEDELKLIGALPTTPAATSQSIITDAPAITETPEEEEAQDTKAGFSGLTENLMIGFAIVATIVVVILIINLSPKKKPKKK